MICVEDLDHLGGKSLGHHLKLWGDKDPTQAGVKGGTVWLQHEIFCVTSNYTIEDIFGPDTDK